MPGEREGSNKKTFHGGRYGYFLEPHNGCLISYVEALSESL